MKKTLLIVTAATAIMMLQSITTANAQSWNLTGNSATTSSKLGTTNNISLRLYTKNIRRVIIDSNGQVGIGIAKPFNIFNVQSSGGTPSSKWITQKGVFAGLGETNTGSSDILSGMASNTASVRALFSLKKARGTLTTPAAVKSNDYLGSFVCGGFDGTNFQYPANIDFIADADATSTNVPARIVFSTGTNSTTRTERLRVDRLGNFSFNSGQVYLNQSTGNLGVGTVTPSYKFDVEASGTAVYGNSTDGGYGVYGYSTYTGVSGYGSSYGVYGSGSYGVYGSGGNYGVYGYSGGNYGVYGSSNYVGVLGSGTSYGLSGTGTASSGSYGVSGSGTYIGVFGTTTSGTAAVVGNNTNGTGGNFHSVNGYGIVAGTDRSDKNYAGVFNGNTYAYGSYLSSDKNLKKNIKELGDAMSIINQLKPKTYEFQKEGRFAVMNLPSGSHYGLIAQELEQVLPGLVKEVDYVGPVAASMPDTTKSANKKVAEPAIAAKEKITTKAVNYIELIPIMIKAMQEQQTTIDKQNEKIEALTQLVNQLSKSSNNIQVTGAYLGNASPNPAAKSTRINYSIPANTAKAELVIYNALGQKIKQTQLSNSGSIDIDISKLSSGTYSYTLVVDGALVNTKQMVIAR